MQKKHLTKFNILHDKNYYQSWHRGTYLNIIKAIYDKPTATSTLSVKKKMKGFPLKSGSRQGYPVSSLLYKGLQEKKTLTSLAIIEMWIKAMVRYRYTPIRMTKIKDQEFQV